MNPQSHSRELTADAGKVQIYGIFVAVALFLILSVPFQWLYGQPMFRFEDISMKEGIILVVVIFLGIALHELIHGLTAILYAGIRTSDAKFGFQWKSMTPYFHSKVPILAGKYRVVISMPLILMGIIPYAAGMVLASGWLVSFGVIFILAAGGDMLILWLMRHVPANTPVQDHPEKIGLIVLEK